MSLLLGGLIMSATGAALTMIGGVMKGVGEHNDSHKKDDDEEEDDDDD